MAEAPFFIQPRIQSSFQKQTVMKTIGASLIQADAGSVVIELPFREDLSQQNGFIHAGIISVIADSACGYAAMSLLPESKEVLSIEFKINLLSPARGDLFTAEAEVVRSGRAITVCHAKVTAHQGTSTKLIALMTATIIAVDGE